MLQPIINQLSSSDSKTDNSFFSAKTNASNEGNWVRGTATTDLKWLLENEKFCFIAFNAHIPIPFDRTLTVNKITVSYKVYRDNSIG